MVKGIGNKRNWKINEIGVNESVFVFGAKIEIVLVEMCVYER